MASALGAPRWRIGAALAVVAVLALVGVAMVLMVPSTPPAAADAIEPFLGTYIGRAQVYGPEGAPTGQRDMEIVIEEKPQGGFQITWSNVHLVDGRRDVPGVERRIDQATFIPSARPRVYVEETRSSLFEQARDPEPMAGDPVRWANIYDDRLGVFSLVIRQDGAYELQSYERILTEYGIDIEFRRIVDGEVVRRITGRTVRVEDEPGTVLE